MIPKPHVTHKKSSLNILDITNNLILPFLNLILIVIFLDIGLVDIDEPAVEGENFGLYD